MNPEQNLHASLPPMLLTQLERAAEAEHMTLDAWLKEALEEQLNRKEWQDVLLFGERHAKARNLTENDIKEAIAAVRSET